jgi:uncharacterized protein
VLKRGDRALFRFVWPGRIFWALPATVVEQSDARVALWIAPYSPIMRPPSLRVPIPKVAAREWTLGEECWLGGGVLMLHERGSAHSIWPRWNESGAFGGWYVNLEDPWRESALGFDTTDHALDIVVRPDRSWEWKDEDDLAKGVEVGLFSPPQARAIRQEGERVVERIESWSAPFDESWENWCPDPAWPMPSIPEGWNRV